MAGQMATLEYGRSTTNEHGDSRAVVIRFIEVHSDLHACMGMVVRCAVCGRAVACIWRLDGMAMI